MEQPFFTSARSDALRWLAMADRQLEARDLHGSRSFAQSARNAEPSLDAEQILAIVDTLLGAERRFVSNQPDWFAVLHLTPLEGLDAGLVSGRFHRLRDLLDPRTNRHPFAEQAFNLIHQAYPNLINPASISWRSLFVAHLSLYSQHLPPQQLTDPINAPMPTALRQNFSLFGGGGGVTVQGGQSSGGGSNSAQPTIQTHNFMGLSPGPNFDIGSGSSISRSGHVQLHNLLNVSDESINREVKEEEKEEDKVEEEEERANSPVTTGDGSTFWTACPYCYYMYEYPQAYVDCAMRCQNCKRVFHAVVITSPPPIVVVDGQESYHFSWQLTPSTHERVEVDGARGEDGQGTSS